MSSTGSRFQKTARPPRTIAFRMMDKESAQLLAGRAALLGITPHKLARQYVLQMLQEPHERADLGEAISGLQAHIGELREDLALTAEALLSAAGKVDEADARKWVDKNFR